MQLLFHSLQSFIVTNKKKFISLIYFPIFFILFATVEHLNLKPVIYVHTPIDDMIPFCEYFVIPYFLWFLYNAFGYFTLFFEERCHDFYRMSTSIMIAMGVFILLSILIPNAQNLRPASFSNHNLCTMLVAWLYKIDTPTNLFPSIHVYNAIALNIGIIKSDRFHKNIFVKTVSWIVFISITLSTMFIKQHSFFDVALALILYAITYLFIYAPFSNHFDKLLHRYDKEYD